MIESAPHPEAARETVASAFDRVYEALTRERDAQPAVAAPETTADEQWYPFERLAGLFGLSPFEADVLVLCAGFSLDARRFVRGEGGLAWPTFGLALTILDEPHWSAITPAGALRYWQLVEVGPGHLLDAPLELDERILQFLLAVPAFDERLQGLVHPLRGSATAPRDRERERDRAVELGTRHWTSSPEPLLLIGTQRSNCEAAFVEVCRHLGLRPYAMSASDIPAAPAERERLARRWAREATLSHGALYLRTEHAESVRELAAWLEPALVPTAVEVRPGSPAEQLDGLRLHLGAMSPGERKDIWSRDLGPLAGQMNGQLDRIAEYFDFDEPAIRVSAAHVRELVAAGDAGDPGELCWSVCREHGRRSLEALAHRVEARAEWSDLVLPASQTATLRQIAVHMRRRTVVNDEWGFRAKHARGLGLTAMFVGDSGTGKTMAAEVLAAELELDLYRVDLASVVSKYIGETEKNLRAIFDGAERSGAVLLFDEADALFGKRSEVRDSHDRYANLEISYLLSQMEKYRGIAILTTNMQHAVDPAFMRRIRFIVSFPFPDAAARADIWRRIFPAATPVAELDFEQIARLNVSGGVIRNIATHAAYLAADDSRVVEARHILAAARTEYAKMERPLTPAEIRGLA
jgi:hypothetical protein